MELISDLRALSDEDLEQEVITWQGRVSAGQFRLLAAIGEVDARGSWNGVGFLTSAHWLGVKLGMAPGTAYEHIRVARKLRELDVIAEEMAHGRLSFSQVRALTRVATPDTQDSWINVARYATGAQLDKLARGVARAKARERGEGGAKHHVAWSYDEDTGDLILTMRCPAEVGIPVIAALEAAMDDAYAEAKAAEEAAAAAGPEPQPVPASPNSSAEELKRPARPPRDGGRQVRAAAVQLLREGSAPPMEDWMRGPFFCTKETRMNGLLHMAQAYLAHRTTSATSGQRAQMTIYADPLTGWSRLADGELLPPAVTAQLVKGRPIPELPQRATNLGRLQRDASAYQRQILAALDGACCRFPGCTRRRKLHAHHIRWWSDGGGTDIDNLVLLCSRHHTLVHDGVYQLRLLPDRTLRVFSPKTLRLVSSRPAQSDDQDPVLRLPSDVDPNAARSRHEGDKLDCGYASAVMCAL